MSFISETYRELFCASGLKTVTLFIEVVCFMACFVSVWFLTFYLNYGFIGIIVSNVITHTLALILYLAFYSKSEIFDKNGNLNEDISAESEIYVIENFITNFPERMLKSQTSRSDKNTFGPTEKPIEEPETQEKNEPQQPKIEESSDTT